MFGIRQNLCLKVLDRLTLEFRMHSSYTLLHHRSLAAAVVIGIRIGIFT